MRNKNTYKHLYVKQSWQNPVFNSKVQDAGYPAFTDFNQQPVTSFCYFFQVGLLLYDAMV